MHQHPLMKIAIQEIHTPRQQRFGWTAWATVPYQRVRERQSVAAGGAAAERGGEAEHALTTLSYTARIITNGKGGQGFVVRIVCTLMWTSGAMHSAWLCCSCPCTTGGKERTD
eukprot:1320122-Pyramimonas_sp.AAC.1